MAYSISETIRLIIDSTPAFIHTALPDGYIDFFNETWLRYVGVPLENIQGWNWTSAIHPDDLEGILKKWRASLASGEPFLHEARVRRADGEYRWMLHQKVALRDEHGNIVKWYGASVDIEDRKRAEEEHHRSAQELQRSESYLADGQRLVHTGSWAFGPAGFDYWSPELFRIHGLDPAGKAPTVQEYLDLIHPQDRQFMANLIKRVLVEPERFDATKRIVRPDGEVRYIRCVGAPVLGSTIKKFVGSAIDVTEHELSTQELHRREAYLAEAQRLSHTGSFGWSVSSGEIFWSEETFRIFEFDRAAKPTLELVLQRVHPEDKTLVQLLIDHARQDGKDFDLEYRLLMPGGSIKYLHVVAHGIKDELDRIEFVGAVMDITERKKAQEAMRAATARFEGILDIAKDAIISVDSNQRIVLFNQGAEKVFGYVADDVLGQPLDILLPQRFAPVHRGHIEAFANATEVSRLMGQRREVFGCRKDGSEFPAEASISKLDLGGEMVFTVILRDITDRKRAEQRLVAQHTVTQMLAEAATLEEATPKILQAVCECLVWDVGELWRIDRVAGVLRCVEVWHKASVEGPHFKAITGDLTFLPGIGLPGRVWSSREPAYIPDVVQDSNFPRASIAAREGLHAAFAFPILLCSEIVGVMDFFSQEIRQPDQDLLDMMATIGSQIGQFIERKRAEEALRKSEGYLADAQKLSRTGSFSWNTATEEIFWSEETFRILEYDRLVKPNLELVLQRVHPEDRTFFEDLINRARQEGKDFDFEHRLLMSNGSIKYMHVVAHAIRDELDQIEFVGAVTDITATKIAEQRIQQDERELRQILDLMPQHLGVLAPDASPLYANYAALEYFGATMEEWCDEGSRLNLVHPDDREHFLGERKKRFLDGAPHEFEARLLRYDGKFRWHLFRLNPLKDERGHIIRWYGTAIDIQDRKRAEEEIRKENIALREEIDKTSMFEEIVGSSAALRKALSEVGKVAPTDSTVLITGETGTGKELIARAIHKRSRRSSRAFVSVNCAAIPQSLIASELFGHEKGAFTGALQRRLGRFELAEGGTIFLDEIGDLPADTQNALLRVLQEREFERVGGTQSIRADVRVIAATNRDLGSAMDNGTFRRDLFYRFNVFPIEIPSLRERKEDIPMLVKYFMDRYASKTGKTIRGVNKSSLELLQSYPWPGNIRELQNVIERSVIICEAENLIVDKNWLAQESIKIQSLGRPLSEELVAREKEKIEAALAETRGRVSGPLGAAARLGIPRSTLDSKIRSLKINTHRFKTF